MTNNLLKPSELIQRLNQKTLVSSSRQLCWNDILVEQYQDLSTSGEVELPATSDHWLTLVMGPPAHLTHKSDGATRQAATLIQQWTKLFLEGKR
jgi:AraC family transcriptional regulator